jgi:hypothetical protein
MKPANSGETSVFTYELVSILLGSRCPTVKPRLHHVRSKEDEILSSQSLDRSNIEASIEVLGFIVSNFFLSVGRQS